MIVFFFDEAQIAMNFIQHSEQSLFNYQYHISSIIYYFPLIISFPNIGFFMATFIQLLPIIALLILGLSDLKAP